MKTTIYQNMTRRARITGTGSYLPGTPVTNAELIARYNLDTTAEWIEEHTGIHSRHFAATDEATSHMAARAAEAALMDAGLDARDLDRIILCTTSGDWTSPAAACNVQRLIGATCPAEDKQAACASFVYGVDHGAMLVAAGLTNVLVVGADVKSRYVDTSDRRLAPIFADGAGAVILSAARDSAEQSAEAGILDCELWTDGSRVENMLTPAGGSAMPASQTTVRENLHTVQMRVDGKQIFEHAAEIMTDLARTVCARAGIDASDLDYFVPHQANAGIMREVARRLRISESRVVRTIDHTANTTSGTIPIALDELFRGKTGPARPRPGALVLMVTAGAGYSGGAVLYRVPEST